MELKPYLREQLREAHELLEAVLGDATSEQLHYLPQGHALPVGAAYAHVIFSEDIVVNSMCRGRPPLLSTGVATGVSEPMPNFAAGEDWGGYAAWTQRVRIDLPQLRQYAQQVYAATDAWLADVTEEALAGERDFGSGPRPLAWAIGRLVIAHTDQLAGEVSAAKGLQGLQGYPF